MNPATATQFPNGIINVPLDPAAIALLAKVPLPNLPGPANNLLTAGRQTNDNNQYATRGSIISSPPPIRFMPRASVFNANEFDPFGSSVLNEALLPGFRAEPDNPFGERVGRRESYPERPRAQPEFRVGFLRVSGGQGDPDMPGLPSRRSMASRARPYTNPRDHGLSPGFLEQRVHVDRIGNWIHKPVGPQRRTLL